MKRTQASKRRDEEAAHESAPGKADPSATSISDEQDPSTETSGEEAEPSGQSSPAAETPQPATVEELAEKMARLEDGLLRSKADYQNLQRRAAMERAEAVRYANADLMRSLLVVLDDFDRAIEAAESGANLDSVMEGVRLVHQNLVKALRENGLEPIEALGQPFDPSVHEALMRQPSPDLPPGTVVQEIAKGYRLRDRVIRPAKVIVTQAPGEEGASGATADKE